MMLFTAGHLQAYERMMQDTGRGFRRCDSEREPPRKPVPRKEQQKPAEKAGEHHGSVQG